MPDDIQRTIYKLEIDDSGYIKGIDSLSASTNKFTQSQEAANKILQTNETALKNSGEEVKKRKKDLDDYAGSNEKYRLQLQKDFKSAQDDNVKLTELVNKNKLAYDNATKSAQAFADASARANTIQQNTTGGKIPTGVPINIQSPLTNISGLQEAAIKSREEFTQLAVAVDLADTKLKTLNENSDEFKLLAPIVEQGKNALQQYADVAGAADTKTLSLKGQLRQAKEELVKLEQAGQGATKQYFELEKKTALLTDQFADQQQRIKILASDTKLLDFGKGAITAATSAFQAYASISVLAGGANEDLQKKTLQLFAAMQLLQSLEQLSNLTRREGILAVHLQSAAQATYTAVVGASTGALKAFKIALIATGIGAAIIGIGYLVNKYIEHREAVKKAAEATKLFRDINEEAAKSVAAQVAKLQLFKDRLNDISLTETDRVRVAKEYNKTASETNQIDTTQINNLQLINEKIDAQNKLIIARALSTAALAKITEASTKQIDAQLTLDQELRKQGLTEDQVSSQIISDINRQIDARNKQTQSLDGYNKATINSQTTISKAASKEVVALYGLITARNDAKKNVDDLAASLRSIITVEGITSDTATKSAKALSDKLLKSVKENSIDLEKELAELQDKQREAEISNISDSFDRQEAELNYQYDKQTAFVKNKIQQILADSDLDPFLSPAIVSVYNAIIAQMNQKRIDSINKIDEERQRAFDNSRTAGEPTLPDRGEPGKTDATKKVETVQAYSEAIGNLTDSIVQFWQSSNDAETRALDRSIYLQEKRVDAAQKIADRGNAQYLKQEQDRLTQLNIQRENAARKQLGIDAALQGSQILVGITGAISKIATPGIGAAETIAEIAIIIGALATGYGLVRSLQGNQPRLKKGKKYVTRDGNPAGEDTIPAWLNEGEAVIPAEKNKAYHSAVSAIYDGTIPAEHMNSFVRNYHSIKGVPQPNYGRIKDAAELSIGQDGKMAVLLTEHSALLKENNELQRMILKKKINIQQSIDRNGVSQMVTEFINQKEIDRHA